MRDVLILAGEASGDLHGSALALQLLRLEPEIRLSGTGGARMQAAGVRLIEHVDGVVGFIEVLRHLPAHLALQRRIRERLESGEIGLVILIDYPGFNLRVAADAKRAGVPVLYYITPQVWAWRASRLETMAEVITRAAVILPFEEPLLRDHDIDATFVGHPLLDRAQDLPAQRAARARIGVSTDGPVLALFPGSRAQEIERHLDDFTAVARELTSRIPELQVVLSVAPTVNLPARALPFPAVRAASFDVLRAATAALCKSGTTTLEAAVADCPCVIVYRTSALSYFIARQFVHIPDIGLLNIVAGRRVAPEFVQDAFQPTAVADALAPLLAPDDLARSVMRRGLAEVRRRLGTAGASERVARMALEMMT